MIRASIKHRLLINLCQVQILAVVPEEAGLHGTNRLDTRDQIASYGPRKTAPEIVKVLRVMYLDVASIHTRDPRLSTCISLRKGTHI